MQQAKKEIPVEAIRRNGDKLNREEALEGHDVTLESAWLTKR